jgi:hypothetical protein
VAVCLGDGRHDGAAGDDTESLARMPEVGIGNRLASLLDRTYGQELQPLRFDQFLEDWVREDRRAMAARLERQPERDDRVHVAGAADRGKEHVK